MAGERRRAVIEALRPGVIEPFRPPSGPLAVEVSAGQPHPVDARLMARPAHEDASGFIGLQVQVSLNNVRGTDYPYLYAVILGKEAFAFPGGPRSTHERGVSLVLEDGRSAGVRYRVVRQYADKSGGWHTGPDEVRGIVAAAVEKARAAWRESGGAP